MRIENSRIDLTVRTDRDVEATQGSDCQRGPANQRSAPESTHAPAPDLLYWVSQVRQTEQVRQDIVRAVRERLAEGEYLTSGAIDRAVNAIMAE